MPYRPETTETTVRMGTVEVEGLNLFFTGEGGEAYLNDLPNAEMHRLDSGHFAVEDCLKYIARDTRRFYDEKVPAS